MKNMLMEVKSRNISCKCEKEVITGDDKAYVMKGSYSERALDIYHLILAPSFQCNIRCRHCYLSNHNDQVIPKERVLRLIDEWADIVVRERGEYGGIFHLKGGEPLLLPYLNDVIRRMGEHKSLQFMITTNGVMGSEEVVCRFGALNEKIDGNVRVIVSLDGSNDSVNSVLRGTGNFDRTVQFIQMLRREGITVYLNNVIHKKNIQDISSFIDLALSLDVQQVNFLSFNPKGYGREIIGLQVGACEVFKSIDKIWKVGNQRVKNLLKGSLSDVLFLEKCGRNTSQECVAGYKGLLYIVPDGTAYSCPNMDFSDLVFGNVMCSDLQSIHDSLERKVYDKLLWLNGERADEPYSCKGVYYNSSLRNAFVMNEAVFDPKALDGDPISYCFSRNF